MGRLFIEYIEQAANSTVKPGKGQGADLQNRQLTATQKNAEEKKQGQMIFTCVQCQIHLADNIDFLSKEFRGKTGTAFLFQKVINVFLGPESEKEMMTGKHVVADIYCAQCSTIIGWTYLKAYEEKQKYKEGKFIIERAYLKPVGLGSEKYQAPADSGDSDDESAIHFNRLLAGRASRPGTASGINLQQIFPGIRGQLIRQALGLGRGPAESDDSDDHPSNAMDDDLEEVN